MILFSVKVSEKHKVKLREDFPEHTFTFCDSPEEAEPYIASAEIYATYGSDVNTSLIEKAANLKWLACLSAGVDGFPFQLLEERGILLTNARGVHKIQMSEYVIAMLLQVYRNTKTMIENERNRVWDKTVRLNEITGKTMLILGTGAIGGEVARLAKAFRMKALGISRSGKPAEYFDEVYKIEDLLQALPEADFIVSVLPSTEETKHLFTYETFSAMKESAVFLNMGRGDAVSEPDLLRAIQEKEIAHAVLDVFEKEPLPEDHPFWSEENITITPHNSGSSPEYISRVLEIFTHNLNTYNNGEGEYINKIDYQRGY